MGRVLAATAAMLVGAVLLREARPIAPGAWDAARILYLAAGLAIGLPGAHFATQFLNLGLYEHLARLRRAAREAGRATPEISRLVMSLAALQFAYYGLGTLIYFFSDGAAFELYVYAAALLLAVSLIQLAANLSIFVTVFFHAMGDYAHEETGDEAARLKLARDQAFIKTALRDMLARNRAAYVETSPQIEFTWKLFFRDVFSTTLYLHAMVYHALFITLFYVQSRTGWTAMIGDGVDSRVEYFLYPYQVYFNIFSFGLIEHFGVRISTLSHDPGRLAFSIALFAMQGVGIILYGASIFGYIGYARLAEQIDRAPDDGAEAERATSDPPPS